MAEEVKQEEKKEKADVKKVISTIFKVILGLVFLALGVWAIKAWWKDLLLVIRGCIGLFLVLAAVITFAIAKE
jgi:mannose/fructose/N-acetylgalactosamine-specific phosphotransferase system component IID